MKLKNQRFTPKKRLQRTYRKFCTSHLILIPKFDISVLDIHKEWKDLISNDQQESDHTLSDHSDIVVPNDVKSVKWADELGRSLTDVHTYMIDPTESAATFCPCYSTTTKATVSSWTGNSILNPLFQLYVICWVSTGEHVTIDCTVSYHQQQPVYRALDHM